MKVFKLKKAIKEIDDLKYGDQKNTTMLDSINKIIQIIKDNTREIEGYGFLETEDFAYIIKKKKPNYVILKG